MTIDQLNDLDISIRQVRGDYRISKTVDPFEFIYMRSDGKFYTTCGEDGCFQNFFQISSALMKHGMLGENCYDQSVLDEYVK